MPSLRGSTEEKLSTKATTSTGVGGGFQIQEMSSIQIEVGSYYTDSSADKNNSSDGPSLTRAQLREAVNSKCH